MPIVETRLNTTTKASGFSYSRGRLYIQRIEVRVLILLGKVLHKNFARLALPLFICVLALVDLIYRSGSVTKRMATASSDDNPIVYSLVRRFPERYELDLYGRVIADTQQNSLISRVSRYLLEINLLSEQSLWVSIIFLQRALLYFAVYVFISTFIESRIRIAFVMTVLASGSVYYWNLGWFGALDDQPYPMWMALPFAILAIAYLRTEKFKGLHFAMIFTTLIHPSIGIMLSGWVVFYFLINRNRKLFVEFSLNAVLNLIYILGTKSFMPAQAEMPKNIQDIALTNPHLNFFNVFSTEFSSSSIRIWILIVCLATVAIFQERKILNFNTNHLVLSLAIYSILLLVLQSIGLMANQLLLISLVPARFTVVLATIAFLLVMVKLSQDLFSASLLKRASSFLTIIFPSPLLFILLLLRELPERILKKYKNGVIRTSELISIGVIGFLVLPTIITKFGYQLANKIYESDPYNSILNPLRTGFMNFIVPSLFSNTKVQILFISLFALICITPLKGKRIISVISKRHWQAQPNWNAFVYFILSCSFVFASKTGMEYQLPWSYNGVKLEKITSYTEAQTWAKNETPENSVFFIDGSMPPYYTWRTLSERPVSNPNPIWSLYNYPKYVDEYNKSRDLFWSRSLSTNKLDYYGQWDEKYFCLSQDLMKISYVVQNLDQPDLNFPIVYKNDFFQIFKVECK